MTTNASFQDDASNVVDAAGDSKYCPEDIKIIPRTRPRENPTAIKHRSAPPIPSSSPTEIIKNETQQNHALPTRTKQRLIKVDYSLLQDDDFYCDIPGSNRLNQSSNSLIQMPLYPTISYNNENNPNNINTTLKRTNGCHIEVRPPTDEGYDFYNFKGWHSTVLLAVVDYRYRFTYINVGAPGRIRDCYLFEISALKKILEANPLFRKHSKKMNVCCIQPFLIGDSAFALSNVMMKPYAFRTTLTSEQINYNKKLSTARRVVENAFGHLKARFRKIGKGLELRVDNINTVIKAACVLHNFLNDHNDKINRTWINEMTVSEAAICRQYPEQFTDRVEGDGDKIRNAIAKYIFEKREIAYDLATQYESRRAPMRRHTIVGCQSNETQLAPTSKSESTQSDINSSSMSTTSQKIQGDHQDQVIELNSMNTGNDKASSTNCNLSSTLTKNSLNENQWTDKISDRLSLTLEEIVHIRSVMTKAELEGLPVGIKVKEDVERRKVCFLCLRTRFSIFGPWGIQCKLCQRTVCSKCYTKMTIPTEHLRNVPVVLLSPSLMNTPISSNASSPSHHSYVAGLNSNYAQSSVVDESLPKSLFEKFLRPESNGKIRNSVGSAPSSPKHQRSTLSTSGSPNDVKNQTMIKSDTSGISDEILDNYKRVKNISNDSIHAPINRNDSVMSKSMEGPKSLPVQSPARPHSNSSTLDRKNRFSRAFTLSSSGHLSDHKENSLRGELMAVCNDCKSLVLEIIRSSRQTRSPARNRALKNLTLDLSPVYKTC